MTFRIIATAAALAFAPLAAQAEDSNLAFTTETSNSGFKAPCRAASASVSASRARWSRTPNCY